MQTKLGSSKVVFKVCNIDSVSYLAVNQVEIDFTGFNIKSIETIYEVMIDFNSTDYDSDVYLIFQEIKDILKARNLNKFPNILNFMSNNMFFESIEIPHLSLLETQKAIDLELSKLYPDYQNRFVYDSVTQVVNKHTSRYNYAFIDYLRYQKVLKWFKDARISLAYVTLNCNAVRRILQKNGFFNKKKNALIINMNHFYTELYNFEGKHLDGMMIANMGYNKVILMASKLYNISLEEARNQLENNLLAIDDYYKESSKEIKFLYEPIILEIKRMIGGFTKDLGIENIYLNFENSSNDFLYTNLEKSLKISFSKFSNIKPHILKELSSYGALIRPSSKYDFNFPLKVRARNEQKR